MSGKWQSITVGDLRKIVNEAIYPQSFSLEEFARCRNFNQRVLYCQKRLQRLGSGTSRVVFLVDDNTVLKLAKNQKGIAQNETEVQNSGYYDSPSFFAKVYEYDENGLWLEMELARKATAADFKRLTNYSFKFLQSFVNYTVNQYIRFKRRIYDTSQINSDVLQSILENSEFYQEMYDYLCNYQLESFGDLCRISSWGVVNRNGQDELVLIDYGLDDTVYKDYYRARI